MGGWVDGVPMAHGIIRAKTQIADVAGIAGIPLTLNTHVHSPLKGELSH
jgi:hypothetical protein